MSSSSPATPSAPAASVGRSRSSEHEPDTGEWTLLTEYADQGTIAESGVTQDPQSPSYLAWHPNGRYLYAVGEVQTGRVWAYEIDDSGRRLSVLGSWPSGGEHPCHLAVDPSGTVLVVANYTSGSLAVHRIRPDGRLGEPTDVVQHGGSGPHPTRQQGPHAHMVHFVSETLLAGRRSRDGRGRRLSARSGDRAAAAGRRADLGTAGRLRAAAPGGAAGWTWWQSSGS